MDMLFYNGQEAVIAIWPNGLRRTMMSKAVFSFLAYSIVATTFPAVSWGQYVNNGCGCANVVYPPASNDSQVYRRFSYEPTPSVQGNVMSGTTMVPFQSTAVMVNPQTISSMQSFVPQTQVYSQSVPTQSYRRFSYQPSPSSATSSHVSDQPWRYSKTDPRRYR